MTTAPFMLCAFWLASSPNVGATAISPGTAAVYIAGGFNVALPTLTLGATAGVTDGFDLDLRYDTHAGLVHDVGLTGRLQLSGDWALALNVSHSFFAIEEVSGIVAVRAPFSNGSTIAPDVRWMISDRSERRISLTSGASVRWLGLDEDEFGTVTRRLELSVRHAFFEVTTEWFDDDTSTWLRIRAIVPIEAEFRVLGFLPWIILGHSWSFQ